MRFDSGIQFDSGAHYDENPKMGGHMLFKLMIDFDRYSDPNFLTKGRLIHTSLTTAPALTNFPDPFPAPYPTRAAILAALTPYELAYAAASGGDRALIATRNGLRQVLSDNLKTLAPYLEAVARAANDITY